ncbi:MAG: VC_2705 family sodium/solute symporter, partial [Burkholderiales bacterium]|nr:VC_2705 family sodium/solute symporter [Burkholderiales bacterium]
AGRPRSLAEARARYQHDHDDALARAQQLAQGPAQTRPYASGDPAGSPAAQARFGHERINFIALMLCLMMGTAAMPHLITRSYTTRSPSQARRSVAWALLFITLLYLAAPLLAVLVKAQVLQQVAGLPIDQLPEWIGRWSRRDPNLVSVHDLNGDGRLQWGELYLGGDLIVLAAPEIGGLPYWVSCLVAAGGLAAALSTADGLLLTIANALTHDIGYRLIAPRATAAARVVASKVMLMVAALLAALVASLDITDILRFVSAAFSLAAAAFFPALVMGVFWRRANRAGAVAAMLVGPGLCLGYMGANLPALRVAFGITQPMARCQWFGVDAVAAGIFAVPAGLLALVVVSLLTAPPGAATQALIDRFRYPQPGE